eukprot:SAG11_NODE_5410_length_1569_cov_4.893878_2_plen_162_part_00
MLHQAARGCDLARSSGTGSMRRRTRSTSGKADDSSPYTAPTPPPKRCAAPSHAPNLPLSPPARLPRHLMSPWSEFAAGGRALWLFGSRLTLGCCALAQATWRLSLAQPVGHDRRKVDPPPVLAPMPLQAPASAEAPPESWSPPVQTVLGCLCRPGQSATFG